MHTHGSPDLAEPPSADTGIYLQPIATPTALGIYGYAAGIAMIGPWLAGWYGTPATPHYLAPFVGIFSGISQFSAAMWAFKSRQTSTTFISGMWAMEHLAWGILFLLLGTGFLSSREEGLTARGIWFGALALIQWTGVLAAAAVNVSLLLAIITGGIGASLVVTADLGHMPWLLVPAGYMLIGSGFIGWYTASAALLQGAFGRPLLPTGLTRRPTRISAGRGEAGIRPGL